MPRTVTLVAALVLTVHGLIHLMGTAVYAGHAEIKGLSYKTTLLSGRWNLGEGGIRIFGVLWVLPAIGFIAVALALLMGWAWRKPVLIGVTLVSLSLTALDWSNYNRIVTKRLSPRFGTRDALRIQPLEIESWLDFVQEREGLQNPTLDKYRRQMFLVYKHGQRHGLIPRTQEANPLNFVRQSSTSDYEAITISAEKTFEILQLMPQPERTLTLLIAATGLRISECLGLQWRDIDYERQKIFVRRAWTRGEIGQPKSKASKAPVPLHALLAAFLREWHALTAYAKPGDWVFPSEKLEGRQPRVANMLV